MSRLALLLSFLLVVLVPLAAHAQEGAPPPPAVTVIAVEPQNVTLTTTLPGRVAASAEAEVRPQVNGIAIERLYEEGGEVETGDALYRIDPASYEATVEQARARVSQAEAQAGATAREAARLQELQAGNIVSERALDDAIAARDEAAAGLHVSRGVHIHIHVHVLI